MSQSFNECVAAICRKDRRYQPDAYGFLLEALDMTFRKLRMGSPEHGRHIRGRELLDGIREYALSEFGPMTYMVLSEWGVHTTGDFGEIVFNMVEVGRLGKSSEDKREDFDDVFDFEDAFVKPFEPGRKRGSTTKAATRRKRGAQG